MWALASVPFHTWGPLVQMLFSHKPEVLWIFLPAGGALTPAPSMNEEVQKDLSGFPEPKLPSYSRLPLESGLSHGGMPARFKMDQGSEKLRKA